MQGLDEAADLSVIQPGVDVRHHRVNDFGIGVRQRLRLFPAGSHHRLVSAVDGVFSPAQRIFDFIRPVVADCPKFFDFFGGNSQGICDFDTGFPS